MSIENIQPKIIPNWARQRLLQWWARTHDNDLEFNLGRKVFEVCSNELGIEWEAWGTLLDPDGVMAIVGRLTKKDAERFSEAINATLIFNDVQERFEFWEGND